MATEVASLVLFAADPGRTAAFYRALDIPLEEERHEEGPAHAAAELGSVHLAVYGSAAPGRPPEPRTAGATFPGFYVGSLDVVGQRLAALGSPVLSGHEAMPWGCRIVVVDPDGRAIEVNERGHCLAG